MTNILLISTPGTKEAAETVWFPAQTVATEPHVALLHADVTAGKEGAAPQPRDEQSPTFLLCPELPPVIPLLPGQLLARGSPGWTKRPS